MTREEAIKIMIEQKFIFFDEYIDYGGVAEAFDMAIRSLEAWDKVIDDLCEQDMKNRYELHMDDYNVGIDQAIDIINKNMKEVEE